MTLYEQIKDDLKTAMKARDTRTLDVLRLLASSIQRKAMDAKEELDDAQVLAVIKSDVKKLSDALKDFTTAAREDLIEATKEEIEVLKKYLPAEMPDDELEEKVRAVLTEKGMTDAADMGKAMGAVMGEMKGAADGNRVRAMVEKILKGE